MAGFSPLSTPKRKRAQLLSEDIPSLHTNAAFSFDPQSTVEDGSMSPRSRVAHKFRGLTLSGGGGVSTSSTTGTTTTAPGGGNNSTRAIEHPFVTWGQDMEENAPKRPRLPDVHMSDADADAAANAASSDLQFPAAPGVGGDPTKQTAATTRRRLQATQTRTEIPETPQPVRRQSPKSARFALIELEVAEQSETVARIGAQTPPSSSPKQSSSPSSRKRAGTPPLTLTAAATAESASDSLVIIDPLRASLTWQDDEITIYDPDDSDDDGTGINGIGFKPTAAIAHRRTVQRRQQLAEYKKREEREARAKRSQRRRGSPASNPSGLVERKDKVEGRRVRFLESATELIGI
ncbi:hypothetical protein B0T17DRAFT_545523 [Bombardia bombarda]|uniref:Uncharacterized protein n=1 Tax=Bombardia bombarda TaxID=252184 RepID=A0AA39TR16_9PEZI|nr:hypothetical protein B0T17DRAFT_545523 [Bombardia bombarda]